MVIQFSKIRTRLVYKRSWTFSRTFKLGVNLLQLKKVTAKTRRMLPIVIPSWKMTNEYTDKRFTITVSGPFIAQCLTLKNNRNLADYKWLISSQWLRQQQRLLDWDSGSPVTSVPIPALRIKSLHLATQSQAVVMSLNGAMTSTTVRCSV